MTLEYYWEFNRNGTTTKFDQEADPLIVKWIDKLGLREENIKVVRETGKDGYAGIKVYYNRDIDFWVIKFTSFLDINHILHKMGVYKLQHLSSLLIQLL